MSSIRVPAWAICTLGSALLFVSGCDKLGHSDTEFARASLERNPDLTIVASDADAKTFTVQVKGSNELHVVRVDEIVGTVASIGAASHTSEPASAATAQPTTPAPATDSLASSNVPAAASTGEPAAPAGASSTEATASQGSGQVTKSSTGEVIASLGSKGESGASTASVPAAEPGAAAATANAATAAGANKRLLASGPGYSITAGEPRANRPLRLAEATELKSPVNAQVEKRYEPIICQGNRLVQIDGRNLEFEGDAVAALDGCEIHITNSHIIAHGLGLRARAANVHIKNSIIEGESGSVSASNGAKLYSQQSTFKGLSRRLDTATFTDLGGTRWD